MPFGDVLIDIDMGESGDGPPSGPPAKGGCLLIGLVFGVPMLVVAILLAVVTVQVIQVMREPMPVTHGSVFRERR